MAILSREEIEAIEQKRGWTFRECFNSWEEVEVYIDEWCEETPDEPSNDWDSRLGSDNSIKRLGRYDFYRVLFNFDVSFSEYPFLEGRTVYFSSAHFGGETDFSYAKFGGETDFSSAHFGGETDFSSAKFGGATYFRAAHFSGLTSFRNAKFGGATYFRDAHFGGATYFNVANFGGSTSFISAHFGGETDFCFARFFGTTDFSATHFGGETYFSYVRVFGSIDFSDAHFGGLTYFSDAHFGGSIYFDSAKFSMDVDFRVITAGELLDFKNSRFIETALFTNATVRTLKLTSAFFDKDAHFLGIAVKRGDRETFRCIKHFLLKENNKIEALKYHAKEMDAYLFRERSGWLNKPQMFLSRCSNYYGLRWEVGVVFTFFTGLGCFFFLAGGVYPDDTAWWSAFWQFLLPTHKLAALLPEGVTPSNSQYVWDIVGRIFVTGGIYQTARAFSKFRFS